MLLLFWRTGSSAPVQQETGRNLFGGGEADYEEFRRKRRDRQKALEDQEREAAELRTRAKEIDQKLRAKKKSTKAKQALQERFDRITDQLAERELQITRILVEIEEMERQAVIYEEMLRRRKLLLLVSMM